MRAADAATQRESRVSTACLLLAWLLTVPVHWAVVTDGFRQSLLEPDGPSQYFDAYADSLRSGRLNVDPYHIGNEAFLVKDRAYGYFGLTPALLRMPLNAAFPSLWGHWARIMMLLGAALSVLGAHWLAICAYGPEPALLSFERRAAHVVYLLIVGLGSTALFLPSRPNVFHEASALGVGLTLAGLGALATWQRRPTLSRALFAALLAVLALHARIVCGAAVVMAAGIVVVLASWRICVRKQRSEPVAQVVVLAVGGLMAAGSYAALNWMKFGTLLSIPIELNLQSSPARLARTGGHMMRLNNVAANAYNYLAPWNVKLGGEGALVQPIAPENLLITPGMDYDWREPVISLWAASPALLTVSLLGLCVLFVAARRKQPASLLVPALIGGAASVTSPLLYFAITQRYSHDMLPFLVVSAALAMEQPSTCPFTACERVSACCSRRPHGACSRGGTSAWCIVCGLPMCASARFATTSSFLPTSVSCASTRTTSRSIPSSATSTANPDARNRHARISSARSRWTRTICLRWCCSRRCGVRAILAVPSIYSCARRAPRRSRLRFTACWAPCCSPRDVRRKPSGSCASPHSSTPAMASPEAGSSTR
jgi:hypothetical protein